MNGYNTGQYLRNKRTKLAQIRECELCGAESGLTVHHIVPVALGGTHELDNLQVLCRTCHGRVDGGRRYAA